MGRIPVVEILEFNNYLRDYFSLHHGLIDIEKYLRKNFGFKSLWDKSMTHVASGKVSLNELFSKIEPDEDLGDWNEDR
jgi:type II secretory ATPase GspE/PulE/Tfp pilus assembly ATPase PilB-like protein